MDESELSQIQDKLAYLRVARPSVFGADIHDFRLNAPLPQADILGFEQKYSVQLPADFRKFISEIGNGGAGPF